MVTNIAIFLLFIAISVSAQTFQYSRGWTNGKRGGRHDVTGALARDDVTKTVERLGPCQLRKLKYLLEGRLNEKFYAPCDYHRDELYSEAKDKDHSPEPLFEVFQ